MRKHDGFTLIELLIVLAILGILVGIVAMSVGDLTDAAQTRGQQSESEIVQLAIDTYNTQKVLVDAEPTIVARASAARVYVTDTANVPFVEYLKRDTKYSFVWEAGGVSLTVSTE